VAVVPGLRCHENETHEYYLDGHEAKTPLQLEIAQASDGESVHAERRNALNKEDKPDCYKCGYRRPVPGSAHSSCAHPEVKGSEVAQDPLHQLMAIFGSVGRVPPSADGNAMQKMGVTCNSEHAIQQGWFNWPWNFDPVWVASCGGFKSQKEVCEECPSSLECVTGADVSARKRSGDCWQAK
jgi:hypothetical protein